MAQQNTDTMLVAMVAGEASGDILGAGLMRALKDRVRNVEFIGIGGPKMEVEGFESLVAMERLSVMGLAEVMPRVPELLNIRRALLNRLLSMRPTLFVGIDAPDFNLALEEKLKINGIKTVHYVSPTVWAWRQSRVHRIKRSVDLLLTLFPFEAAFYREHEVAVEFVGHPLADSIPLTIDKQQAELSLNRLIHSPFNSQAKRLAILPGSRANEIRYIGATFLVAAAKLYQSGHNIEILIPCANPARKQQLKVLIMNHRLTHLPIHLTDGYSRDVMAAADAVLLASGTATLEAMLLKKPMVVGYRVSPFTFSIVSRLVKIDNIALPNLLAKETIVPELIQEKLTVDNVVEQLAPLLTAEASRGGTPEDKSDLVRCFDNIHRELRKNASEKAAEACLRGLTK